MKNPDDRVDREKQRLVKRFAKAPWFMGLGIGRVESGIGLVLSVKPGSRRTALDALAALPLDFAVVVREVGTVRAR